MEPLQEVAFTSCLNDSVVSAYVWDVNTGSSLMSYRGDTAVASGGLSVMGQQFVVAALQDKPFLRLWPVNSQQPVSSLRLVCPGRVTHAQASPDDCYIALTVAEKLHIYQVASGRLVGSGVRHFQPISALRWIGDGSMVICGGEDGLVSVWDLASLTAVTATADSTTEPRHLLADHTLPVTDLAITAGSRPRLLSVSADRTCKIYDLLHGQLLVSVVFDNMLTAVTTTVLETDLFVGTESGAILQLSLLAPPRQLEYHITAEEPARVFTGHTKAVRQLSASLLGDLLLSGSTDFSVRIWHITSRQCLRTIAHKGPVTNAFFIIKPNQLFDTELKPGIVISAFKTANSEDSDCVEVITKHTLALCDDMDRDIFPSQVTDFSEEKQKSLQMEIDLLRSTNTNLYKFVVDKVIGNNFSSPDVPKVVEQQPVIKNRKRKKGKVISNDTLINNSTSSVPSINGTTKKKRKRKKKKSKISNAI